MSTGNRFRLGVVCFAVAILAGACGERQRRDAAPEGAEEAPPVSPDSYVPPKTYPVATYRVPAAAIGVGSPLSDQADGELGIHLTDASERPLSPLSLHGTRSSVAQGLRLAEGVEPTFYTGFPISVSFGLEMEGGGGQMLVNFGLIEKAADGVPEDQRGAFKACSLGSAQATYDEATAAGGGTVRFNAKFLIPESCLRDGNPTRMMLYIAANPDGSVQPASGPKRVFVVLDDKTVEENGICLKLDKNADGCQNTIMIAKSPGVNVRLVDFVGDSSVGVLPAADPAITFSEQQRLPRPMLVTNGQVAVEGLAPDAADLASYKVELRYELCSGSNLDATTGTACDANLDWQRLNALESVPEVEDLTLVGRSQLIETVTLDKPMGISAPLHAIDGLYRVLRKESQGAWANLKDFRVRACAVLLKDGVPAIQANLDSQAVNGAATGDDCRIFPFLLADERVDESQPCESDGALGGASLLGSVDCKDDVVAGGGSGLHGFASQPSFLQDPDDSTKETGDVSVGSNLLSNIATIGTIGKRRVLMPTASFWNGYSGGWGSDGSFKLSASAGTGLTMTPVVMDFNASGMVRLDGYISTEILSAYFNAHFDLTGADIHYVDPGVKVFGIKIWGARSDLPGNEIVYNIPIKQIGGGSGKSKKVGKAKVKKIEPPPSKNERYKLSDVGVDVGGPNALYVKEVCRTWGVGLEIITLGVTVCGDIGLYLTAGAAGVVRKPGDDEQGLFPQGKRLVNGALFFIPSVAANASITAGVDIAIGRAGVGGEINLVEVLLPFVLSARFGNFLGLVDAGPGAGDAALGMRLAVDFTINLEINYLSGRFFAYAALDGLQWCEEWGIPYPCGWGEIWRTEVTLFGWTGGSSSFTLMKQQLDRRSWLPFWGSSSTDCTTALGQGDLLRVGEVLCSSDDKLKLQIELSTGTAIVTDKLGNVGWRSHQEATPDLTSAYLEIAQQLRLRGVGARDVLWESPRNPMVFGESILTLSEAGTLFLVRQEDGKVIWNSDEEPPESTMPERSVLATGDTLQRGKTMRSMGKEVFLKLTESALYLGRGLTLKKIMTFPSDKPASRLSMGKDGLRVLYGGKENYHLLKPTVTPPVGRGGKAPDLWLEVTDQGLRMLVDGSNQVVYSEPAP